MATGFLLLYWIFDVRAFFYVAIGVALASLISSTLENWIVLVWMKIAEVLGRINATILLSAIFFVILFPVAMLARLFRKDTLDLKKPRASMYHTRNHVYTAEDLENPW